MAQKGEKPLGVKMSISSWPVSTDQKVEQPVKTSTSTSMSTTSPSTSTTSPSTSTSISNWPPPRSQPTSSSTGLSSVETVVPTLSHEPKRRRLEEPRSASSHARTRTVARTNVPVQCVEAQLVLPLTFLARHIRKHGYGNPYENTTTTNNMEGASSTTRLYAFARSRTGQQLLQGQRDVYSRALATSKSNDDTDCKTILAAHLMQLNEPDKALVLLRAACAVDVADPHPDATWLREIAKRQTEVKVLQICLSEEFKLKTGNVENKVTQVERRSSKTLTTEDFFTLYAKARVPVIITDVEVVTHPWSISRVANVIGDTQVTVKRNVAQSTEWAGLEDAERVSVADFCHRLLPQGDRYLFDWSLPLFAPKLGKEVSIPKYFKGDLIQQTSQGTLYRDSWPSLFIGPKGLCSELHVDTFGSNFWMFVFEGKKEWVFFDEKDVPLLYPRYHDSVDATFDVDVENPDFTAHPLFRHASRRECVLGPGELLFVPAGCPHHVRNLSDSLAISGNYVDASNVEHALKELWCAGVRDERALDLAEQLETLHTGKE